MKNRVRFVCCLLCAAAFVGCKSNDEGKYHFDNKVFIAGNSFTDHVFVKRDNLDVTKRERCEVSVAMAQPREREITVTFAEAPELLDHYRKFYEDPSARLLPADGGYYNLSDLSAVIPAGAVESAPIAFEFDNLDRLPIDERQRYVLPVTIVSADGMEVLESARTVYFIFAKAALINVVAEMQNNCAWPEWTAETAAVKDMERFTLEALVYANSFKRKISTIMGVEDLFMVRLGDNGPENQLQVAYAKKVSEEETAPARSRIPASPNSKFDLKPFRWYHIAVTFDRGTVSIYIDGKLKETARAEVSGTSGSPVLLDKVNFAIPHSDEAEGKPRCFWIGHSYRLLSDGELFYERRFDGMMSEIRIWNKALSEAEINAPNHFYKVNPRSEGLVAYWKFDDNAKGKTVKDYTANGFDLKTEREVNWQSVALPEE